MINQNLVRWATILAISALIPVVMVILVGNQLRLPLYLLSSTMVGILLYVVSNSFKTFKFETDNSRFRKIVDYFLVSCSVAVLISQTLTPNVITFIISLIVIFFMPGWVLLRLIAPELLKIETSSLVLCFGLSLGISSLVFFAVLFIGNIHGFILSAILTTLSVLPVIKEHTRLRRKPSKKTINYQFVLADGLFLLWVSVLFVFVISTLYPLMSHVPGYDIIRHYSSSKTLLETPDIYGSQYPLFHAMWASVLALSSTNIETFLSGVAFLSIIVLLAFYSMSRVYLDGIDKRAGIISSFIFSAFAGFGWIYYVKTLTGLGTMQLLSSLGQAYNPTYWDVGLGQATFLWLWFRPITVGFLLLFTLIYMMKRVDIDKRKYIIICSLLVFTLSQIHFSEIIIFASLVFCCAVFIPRVKLMLRETAISIGIGGILSGLMIPVYQRLFTSGFSPITGQYLVVLIIIVIATLILLKYKYRPKIEIRKNLNFLGIIALFLYLVIFSYWLSNADNYLSLSSISRISAVPIEFYPMLLGLAGIFAIPGIVIILGKSENEIIIVFVLLFLLGLIFGRSITVINVNVEDTNYWERRFTPIVFGGAAIVASIAIIRLVGFMQTRLQIRDKNSVTANVLPSVVLACIVIMGVFSTLLTVEYQLEYSKINQVAHGEKALQDTLADADPYSTLLTITERSKEVAEFKNLGYLIGYYRYQVWPAQRPELPLNIMFALNSSAIIYLDNKDIKSPILDYSDGYVGSHLLKLGKVLKNDNSSLVVNVPRMTPPVDNSQVVLVLPDEIIKKENWYAYDLLSLGGYNYTTAPISDINTLKNAKIIIAPSEDLAEKVAYYKKNYDFKLQQLIIINTEGYGSLVNVAHERKISNTSSWRASGTGIGTIGIPSMKSSKISPSNSSLSDYTAVSRKMGIYAYWKIENNFPEPVNVSNNNFAEFGWFGSENNKWYSLRFLEPSGNVLWFKFKDTWTGWRQVILPIGMSNGPSIINGIEIEKVAGNNTSWFKISSVDVGPELSNINDNSTHYISNIYFGNSQAADSVSGGLGRTFKLPVNVSTYPLDYPVGFEPKSNYSKGIPLILYKPFRNYDLYYLNVVPLLERINTGDDQARLLYNSVQHVMGLVNADLPRFEYMNRSKISLVNGGVAAFREFSAAGNLTIAPKSLIVNVRGQNVFASIDGRQVSLNNVSQIIPINSEHLNIRALKARINSGTGFYSRAHLEDAALISEGNTTDVLVKFGNSSRVISGKVLLFRFSNIDILARQALVSSIGKTEFVHFYGYGELNNNLRILGQGFTVDGKVDFVTKYSDRYTVVNGFKLKGTIDRSIPLYGYNELITISDIFSIQNIIRYSSTIIFLYAALRIYYPRRTMIKDV